MKRKGAFRLVVVLSMCLLVIHLHAQEAIQVVGLFSDAISLGCGSEQGVKVGATGRVYLREMVGGKMWPIYIAKFRVTSVEANNCRAKILEKTRDIAIGHFITFDKPLVPPAAKPAPAAEPKAEKPQAKPANAASARTYSLSISTVPEDVMIYINGKKSGRGPLKMDMSKPDCDVRIERNGYATIEDSFTISENGMTKNYELKPLTVAVPAVAAKPVAEKKLEMGKYPVRIVVEPADAEININGNKGRSPFEVMLNTPRCQVSIVRSGYETVSETLDLSEGGVIKNYKLNPMIAASIAVGQKKGTLTAAESLNLKEIDKNISKAKSKRTWGWILMVPTVLYTGYMLAGFIAFLVDSDNTENELLMLTGIPTAVISIVGFSMILRGNSNVKRYRKIKADLRLGLDIRPNMKHYGISFSLVF